MPKKKAKKKRVKGKAQVLYFPGDKLDLLKKVKKAAKARKQAFSEYVLDRL